MYKREERIVLGRIGGQRGMEVRKQIPKTDLVENGDT